MLYHSKNKKAISFFCKRSHTLLLCNKKQRVGKRLPAVFWSKCGDSNSVPLGPKPSALPGELHLDITAEQGGVPPFLHCTPFCGESQGESGRIEAESRSRSTPRHIDGGGFYAIQPWSQLPLQLPAVVAMVDHEFCLSAVDADILAGDEARLV